LRTLMERCGFSLQGLVSHSGNCNRSEGIA
jgi:hypothetical protein